MSEISTNEQLILKTLERLERGQETLTKSINSIDKSVVALSTRFDNSENEIHELKEDFKKYKEKDNNNTSNNKNGVISFSRQQIVYFIIVLIVFIGGLLLGGSNLKDGLKESNKYLNLPKNKTNK